MLSDTHAPEIFVLNSKLKVAVLCGLLLLGLLLLRLPRPHFLPLDPIAFAFGCFSIVFSATLITLCLSGRVWEFRTSTVDIACGAAVLLTVLSHLFMSPPDQNGSRLYMVFATFILFLVIRLSYRRYLSRNLDIVFILLVGVSGVEALYGLRQWMAGTPLHGHFFNANYFAMYLSMNIPLALALARNKAYRLPQHAGAILVAILLLFCVVLSRCRTAYAGLCFTLLISFIVQYGPALRRRLHSRSRRLVQVLFAASGLMFVLCVVVLFSLKPLSVAGRILVWKVSLRMFLDAPILGVGFGNFASVYNMYQGHFFGQGLGSAMERLAATDISEAFNGYVESVAEFGIVGLAIYGFFWVMVMKTIWDTFSRFCRIEPDDGRGLGELAEVIPGQQKGISRPSGTDSMILGMAGSALLFMIMSLFYTACRFTSIYLIFTMCLACLVSALQVHRCFASGRQEEPPQVKSRRRLHRLLWVSFSGLACLVSLGHVPALYDQYTGGKEWYTAQRLGRKGQFERAIAGYHEAYPKLSDDERFLSAFGRTLAESGDEAEAITCFEQSLKIRPSPFVLEDLAMARERAGHVQEAIDGAVLASRILPWRITPQFMLADLHYQLGDSTNAATWAQRVLDTPVKKMSERGSLIRTQARTLLEYLGMPMNEIRARRERAISLVPASHQAAVRKSLSTAGANECQLIEAIGVISPAQRGALIFLLINMPREDLKSLTADFLVTNTDYAFQAKSSFLYSAAVPESIFLDCVLPYANVNEHRDNWRADFHLRFKEMALGCSTTAEAATKLNFEIFTALHVGFGLKRPQDPVQSPYESMVKGYASCEALSVLLADACRAVGIPSRLVFIPEWVDVKGGHTWIEVYDHGRWLCMAALDATIPEWPCERASGTDPTKPEHRIYAVSFERTGLHMTYGQDVSLIDITDRLLYQERSP